MDLLNRADTVAVFQVESKGMRDMLRKIGLGRFEDLIALIALFRPGPMQFLDSFGERRNGRATIEYEHPKLEPILKETYGIMVYQECGRQHRRPPSYGVAPGAARGRSCRKTSTRPHPGPTPLQAPERPS